jgi:hypothetical protein
MGGTCRMNKRDAYTILTKNAKERHHLRHLAERRW